MQRIQRNIITGLLTALPLLLTAWVVSFVVDIMVAGGRPLVDGIARSLQESLPEVAALLRDPTFQSVLAVFVTLVVLYLLGALATQVLGRRMLALFDRLMARIPLVQSVYGAVRKLITALQSAPAGQQRVVLIEFPTPEMKALGFVTKIFDDADGGGAIAAVYVPTAPNPTSGYMELVPVERLVFLDWTANDAMQFILSGGTAAPEHLGFGPRYRPPNAPG